MKRLKSVDIFRGLSMLWMFIGHLQAWWLGEEDVWLYYLSFKIVDPIGSSAFIFIAGLSTALSLQSRFVKAQLSESYNYRIIRREYLFRAFFIFLIALIYNISIAIGLLNPLWVWTWFVLLTVSVSLLISWILLKISFPLRMMIGIIIWILNQILLGYLTPFQGQININGILFHLFYHRLGLDPILSFLPFFLFGTIIGETIFKIYKNEDNKLMKKALKNRLIYPSLIIGIVLIILGVSINYPNFLINRSFQWMIYTLGIILILFAILITFEEYNLIKLKRSYNFLFYFSYYSLTIYFLHNLLYFIFYGQLNSFSIWFFILITCVLTGILLKLIYVKFGSKFSLKIQIGKLASILAKKVKKKNPI